MPRGKPIYKGERFGLLTALEDAGSDGNGYRRWLCLCDCGEVCTKRSSHLRSSAAPSCGCIVNKSRKEALEKHGMARTPEYRAWISCKSRCHNQNHKNFKDYGARGIAVCSRWRNSFDAFYQDMGPRPEGMTLERNDVNGNYSPDNCVWASPKDQARNRRNSVYVDWRGASVPLSVAANDLGISISAAHHRLKRGKLYGDP